jgi:hypothetical protein
MVETGESPREALARMDAERAAEEARALAMRESLRRELGGDVAGLEARLSAAQVEREALAERRRPIDEALVRNHEEQSAIADILAEARMAAATGKGTDWAMLLDARNEGRAMREALGAALAPYGLQEDWALGQFGQRGIALALWQDDEAGQARAAEGLRLVGPYLKTDRDGLVRVSIRESSLSLHGIWYLFAPPDMSSAIVGEGEHCFGGNEFSSLEEALEYVRQALWYKPGVPEVAGGVSPGRSP